MKNFHSPTDIACWPAKLFEFLFLHHATALNVSLTKHVDAKLQNIKTVFSFRYTFCKNRYLSDIRGNATALTLKESVETYLQGKTKQQLARTQINRNCNFFCFFFVWV
jgi:hypothetical protein